LTASHVGGGMEETARKLHEAWRGRNVLKAKTDEKDSEGKKVGESHIPYKKLSDKDKIKVRNFVKLAIDIYNDMDCSM
jgi:hypothetical protein